MKRLWTRSLAGQLIVLLLLALVLSQAIGFVIYRDERTQAAARSAEGGVPGAHRGGHPPARQSPGELHGEILRAGGSGITRYWLRVPSLCESGAWQDAWHCSHLRQALPARLRGRPAGPPGGRCASA